jgi:succinyl-diaminopimelate desuccinylase
MSSEALATAIARVDAMRDEIVNSLIELCRIPALSPKSGGKGELKKVEYLEKLVHSIGFDEVTRYDAPDETAEGGIRPNLIAKLWGKEKEKGTLWIVTHTDVVPAGDLSLWDTDPFEPVIKGDKLYGRGVEDNGQSLISSLYAVKALKDAGLVPIRNIGIALAADEEMGSANGMKFLMAKNLFQPDDLIVVPDYGSAKGDFIEVAEKSILWLKCTTEGKQCHASMPHQGKNAFRAGMVFAIEVDKALHAKFNDKNELFDPSESTFEPTKKESNVPNVNTIPGSDVFYIDTRLLPHYKVDEVLRLVEEIAKRVEADYGVKIRIEPVQREDAAPATSPDSPVVKVLKKCINSVYSVEPKIGGIGGGTCAAIFRKHGLNAACWSKIDETAHQPNEYIWIDNLINDTKVWVHLYMSA